MDARAALREHFGFDDFRPGQEQAVEAVLAGRDALVVMPTGAGKSLCYQLPALMRDDLTLVVSPLVALMADQVQALERIAPGRVALINAQADLDDNRSALRRAVAGELKLLYVAPERFASEGFAEAIAGANVGLFVVDEAHCVSQWGHDFRPDYFRLAHAAHSLGARSIMASTATATPQVAGDILVRLNLRDPVRVSTGFDRPNLSFAVVPCATAADKHARIAAALAEDGALPAIVYAGTRAGSERLAKRLTADLGEPVPAYHAGLERAARADVQRRFMDGSARVVVATNAFGMGIDKADVRTVCHETVPQSVEAYYQEAGRGGRDGAPARALLFAERKDKALHVYFIREADLDEAATKARWREYRSVWAYVEQDRCRRRAILRHFGDRTEPSPSVPCCDVCDARALPVAPVRAARPAATSAPGAVPGDLEAAILEVVSRASPEIGRTRTVEVLRGGRSKVVAKYSYDGLPGYGAFAHMRAEDVLAHVDGLLASGRLRSTGGRFPKLEVAQQRLVA